jgi:hypothetical protein
VVIQLQINGNINEWWADKNLEGYDRGIFHRLLNCALFLLNFCWKCVVSGSKAPKREADHHFYLMPRLRMRDSPWIGFEVFTAASMKMAVFWVVVPCSLVEVYQRFRGPCCLHIIALMMEASRTSVTLVNFYQTTRRRNPEYSYLLPHKCSWRRGYGCGKFYLLFKLKVQLHVKNKITAVYI